MKTRVRYMEDRPLANGRVGYYYNPPKAARKAGILERGPLGQNLEEAIAKAGVYNRLLDEWRKERRGQVTIGPMPGTVSALIDAYLRSDKFASKAPKTRASYEACLNRFENYVLPSGRRLGDIQAKALENRHVDKIYEAFQERRPDPTQPPGKNGPILVATKLAQANAIMRTASVVWSFGKRQNAVSENPFLKMGKIGTPPRSVTWSPGQVAKFVAQAMKDGWASVGVAAMLAYELGQRLSDAQSTIRWSDYDEARGRIRLTQGKTNRDVSVPVSDVLRAMLDVIPRRAGLIVVREDTGEPWKDDAFSKRAAQIRAAAKLPKELQVRDMRRTALTELGNAGGTDQQLQAVSGHSDREILSTYTLPTEAQATEVLKLRWGTAERRELIDGLKEAGLIPNAAPAAIPNEEET